MYAYRSWIGVTPGHLQVCDSSTHRDALRYGASRCAPVNADACGFANGCTAQMIVSRGRCALSGSSATPEADITNPRHGVSQAVSPEAGDPRCDGGSQRSVVTSATGVPVRQFTICSIGPASVGQFANLPFCDPRGNG